MKIVLYPGTFDPIHLGHLHVIKVAMSFCDTLIVGVAYSKLKDPLLSYEQRIDMCKHVIKHEVPNSNIQIIGFKGLMVDLAQEVSAQCIVRGIRCHNFSNMSHEFSMAQTNAMLDKNIYTVFVPNFTHGNISSTLVKHIMKFPKAQISNFLPSSAIHYLARIGFLQ